MEQQDLWHVTFKSTWTSGTHVESRTTETYLAMTDGTIAELKDRCQELSGPRHSNVVIVKAEQLGKCWIKTS